VPTADLDENAVFAALASPLRRELLDLLRAGERNAGELAAAFAVSRPAVSQHLAVLQQARLVEERRAGRHRVYALRAGPLRAVTDWLGPYQDFWTERLDALGRHLRDRHGEPPAARTDEKGQ
jgi:DNA-binding transcriptional ArsR family regulator